MDQIIAYLGLEFYPFWFLKMVGFSADNAYIFRWILDIKTKNDT